jgi:hypothetical protein
MLIKLIVAASISGFGMVHNRVSRSLVFQSPAATDSDHNAMPMFGSRRQIGR